MPHPKILLHTDSAYFTTYVHRQLKKNQFEIMGYWFNPQIHPYSEYRKRFLMHQLYAVLEDLPMIYLEGYPVGKYLDGYPAAKGKPDICNYCFHHVLDKVAAYAKRLEMPYFTSTWCADPGINQKVLKKTGEDLAEKYEIKFYYQPYYQHAKEVFQASDELKLYHQNWCGCLLTEAEYSQKAEKRK